MKGLDMFFKITPARNTLGSCIVAATVTAAINVALCLGIWWIAVKAICWALLQLRAAWGA